MLINSIKAIPKNHTIPMKIMEIYLYNFFFLVIPSVARNESSDSYDKHNWASIKAEWILKWILDDTLRWKWNNEFDVHNQK